ncbi:MAG: hypothetical protein KBD65_02120 [Candidatus Moranbacteria bacterium]|nr:hypothetical protein [Candidatus Moranbacteria bacterium]
MNKKRVIYFAVTAILFLAASCAGFFFGGVPSAKDMDFNAGDGKSVTSVMLPEDSGVTTPDAILPKKSMIDQIVQGVKEEYPYLATLESSTNQLKIEIEDNSNGYAIGRYSYPQKDFGSSGTWFAENTSEGWKVFNVGYNYWGDCQYFWENEFPKDMTPDCYDYEKMEHIETTNPKRFFTDGFSLKDKEEIIQAYIAFKKAQSKGVAKAEDLAIRVGTQTKNYLEGMMLTERVEEHSNPAFFAVRTDTGWRVIFEGQSPPPCDLVEMYNFPISIVSTCVVTGKTPSDDVFKNR